MSGPDGGYGQAPYRPGPESGPPAGNPTGGQFAGGYPPSGQVPPAGQYPSAGLYPSAGQHQPPRDDPSANPARVRSAGPDPAKLLGLAVAGLGGLNFIWGFLPELTAPRIEADLSVFAVGPGYVPILLLIAGLLALAALLPGSERSRLAVAAVSVGGAAGAIVSLGTPGPVEQLATGRAGQGLGAILLVIFGIIQAVVAIAGYVVGADFSKRLPGNADPAAGPPAATVQPGWFNPSAGVMPAGYAAPLGTLPGSVQPGVPQNWWPDPSEAATGPQVVVPPEVRRDGDTDSAPGGVPGRQP